MRSSATSRIASLARGVAEPKREVRPGRVAEAMGSRELHPVWRAAPKESHRARVPDWQGLLLVTDESDSRAGGVQRRREARTRPRGPACPLHRRRCDPRVDADPGAAIDAARSWVSLADREPPPFRCAGRVGRPSPSVVVEKLVEGRRCAHRFAPCDSGSLLGRRDDDHLVAAPPKSSARDFEHRGLTCAGRRRR